MTAVYFPRFDGASPPGGPKLLPQAAPIPVEWKDMWRGEWKDYSHVKKSLIHTQLKLVPPTKVLSGLESIEFLLGHTNNLNRIVITAASNLIIDVRNLVPMAVIKEHLTAMGLSRTAGYIIPGYVVSRDPEEAWKMWTYLIGRYDIPNDLVAFVNEYLKPAS